MRSVPVRWSARVMRASPPKASHGVDDALVVGGHHDVMNGLRLLGAFVDALHHGLAGQRNQRLAGQARGSVTRGNDHNYSWIVGAHRGFYRQNVGVLRCMRSTRVQPTPVTKLDSISRMNSARLLLSSNSSMVEFMLKSIRAAVPGGTGGSGGSRETRSGFEFSLSASLHFCLPAWSAVLPRSRRKRKVLPLRGQR